MSHDDNFDTCGEYSNTATYHRNDAVYVIGDGGTISGYALIVDESRGHAPPDLDYWQPLGQSVAPTPLSNATPHALGVAAPGTGTAASRDDHVHPTELPSQSGNAGKVLGTDGSSASWVADAVGPPLSDATPSALGTAAPGTSTAASRGDHVHPTEIPSQSGNAGKVLGTDGSTTSWVDDAVGPPLSDATPQALGTAASGTGTSASRDDHVHPTELPDQSGNAGKVLGTDGTSAAWVAEPPADYPNPSVTDDTVSSGEVSIDGNKLNTLHRVALSGSATLSVDSPIAGETYQFKITNAGSFAITWPASFKWPGGTAPTLTPSGVDYVTASYDGTDFYATYAQAFV